MLAGSAGERFVGVAQDDRSEVMLRRRGAQEVGVEHGGVADVLDRAGEKLGEFRVMDDFGALGVGQKFGERGGDFAFVVAPGGARDAGLRRKLKGGHARAETFGFALAGVEREPDGDGLARRRGIQESADGGGRIERGVVGNDRRDRGGCGKIAQERGEAELGVEVAQRGVIGFAALDGFEIEIDGRVGGDGGELLRERDLILTIDERFAVAFAFDFGGVLQRRFR